MDNIKKSPFSYNQAAELARLAGQAMLQQLPWMAIKPKVVVDMGSGAGEHTRALQQCYPESTVIAIDISSAMLRYGKQYHMQNSMQTSASDTVYWVQAEGCQLPLAHQSVDLIFANFFLAWQADLNLIWQEWLRILRPNGLVMFNLFGPDTIANYRDDFRAQWLPGVIDLHDVGDMLLKQGFCDPVISTDYYNFQYKSNIHLLEELYHSDLLLSLSDLANKMPAQEKYQITFEIVMAHAFAATIENETEKKTAGVTRLPLAMMREQLASHKRKT